MTDVGPDAEAMGSDVGDENRKPKSKSKGKRGAVTYRAQLGNLFKKRCPGASISGKTLGVVDALARDIEARVTKRAVEVMKLDHKSTLGVKHIVAAAEVSLPPELGQMAVRDSGAAYNKFVGNKPAGKK